MGWMERARDTARGFSWPCTSVERAWLEALGMKARKRKRRRERSAKRKAGYEPTRREAIECMDQRTGANPEGE